MDIFRMEKMKLAILSIIGFIFFLSLTSATITINLTSPADGSTQYTGLITTSANINITTGLGIVNSTFYTNETGSWGARNTTLITSPATQGTGLVPSGTGSVTDKRGEKFIVNINNTLTVVQKSSNSTADMAFLQDSSHNPLANASFVGNNATFNYPLVAGTTYYILAANAAGTAYVQAFDQISPYPVTGTYINYTAGYISGADSSQYRLNIVNLFITYNPSNSTNNFTNTYSAGKTILWNEQYCYTNNSCNFAPQNFTFFIDNQAPTLTMNYPTGIIPFGGVNQTLQLNFTATDTNLASCWYNYNGTNISVSCSSGIANLANITLSSKKNVTLYANDTLGNLISQTDSWDYQVFNNQKTFNSSTFQTANEAFQTNVTANSSLTAVTLNYNGTLYSLTNRGNGIWNTSFDIPSTNSGNYSLNYIYTYAGNPINGQTFYQNVTNLTWTNCNSSAWLNITFQDEASLTSINATIPTSTFTYYLGSGSQTKSLSYTNNTNNTYYAFCSNAVGRTIYVTPVLQYLQGTAYPQRIWNPSLQAYTNTTTNQVLYLTSSTTGIYVTYTVKNLALQSISGVSVVVNRTISGNNVIIGNGLTDDSGSITFFLNPDFQHIIVFTKVGYSPSTLTQFPTQSIYSVILSLQGNSNNTFPTNGVTANVQPTNNFINSETIYNFNYTLSSTISSFQLWGYSLVFDNGTIIDTQTSTNPNGGILNTNANTSNVSKIIMNYYYEVNNTFVNNSQYWIVSSGTNTDASIMASISYFTTYVNLGIFGIDSFGKAILASLILIIVAGVMSFKYGWNSEQAILGVMFGAVLFMEVGMNPPLIPPILNSSMPVATIFVGVILLLSIVKEELK